MVVSGGIAPPIEWLKLVDPRIRKLTVQELLALNCLRDGMPDKQIAGALDISIDVARFHLENARKKIGCKSRIEAALWADRNIFPPGFIRALVTAIYGQ